MESIEQISTSLRKHFNFLFQNSFEIVNSTIEKEPIFYIVLDGKFRILIGRALDGEVYIQFAPLSTPIHSWKEWYSLRLLLYYLSNKSFFLEPISVEIEKDIQLERLAKLVFVHFQRIFDLFVSDDFAFLQRNKESLEKELLEVEKKLISQENRKGFLAS